MLPPLQITEEIPSHVGLGEAEVATPESLGKTTDDSPISLIALGDSKETTFGSHDKIVSKMKLNSKLKMEVLFVYFLFGN